GAVLVQSRQGSPGRVRRSVRRTTAHAASPRARGAVGARRAHARGTAGLPRLARAGMGSGRALVPGGRRRGGGRVRLRLSGNLVRTGAGRAPTASDVAYKTRATHAADAGQRQGWV